ncbi:PD-(D/E)XK nuclease family protein [Enterococcus villorum]|uniref:ATP-dependent helicase/deoxyribonuclease subunit B n=2 Tax=Enterococcus villorum TaxID=112904 RepID=A0A511IYL7_9ENTE|nr:PD-(D/E)XK nuclease family protein [Enterococcus villorum]EOH89909.1 helicase-exonuclease AddAB, AddB subunit [Enterococcus villorum ATCC 700913]EOW78141.1 helicase-exonuclease AddAB, AddB subunit [Enterococcus villorum ATCC 700913]GEL90854.1 ATP-dependent helicase/deoxyribonuclease subunit B [Enterococcus villorum]
MSLQFILGTARKDHQAMLIDEAVDWLAEDRNHQVFFLVPNYNKFEQEQEILAQLRKKSGKSAFSTTNVQVFSFYRLAWYLLQQTTLLSGNELTESGSAMILRQILEKNEENLTIFRGEINKKGFIKQLQELYNELQIGKIAPEDLVFSQPTESPKEENQQLKMKDLQLIFTAFEEELLKRALQVEDALTILANYMQTQEMSEVKFIVSGFTRVNAQEYQLLQVMMEKGRLVVDLLLDRPYITEMPELLTLFHETGKLYFQLISSAKERKIPVFVEKYAPAHSLPFALQNLQKMWEDTSSNKKIKPIKLEEQEALKVWEAENATEEVRQLAVEIRRLVSEEHYRYRDIQILTKDMGFYGNLIQPVFKEMAIPYYIDEEQLMENHPLIEWINSLFSLDRYAYRLNDIMRFFKTELFICEEDQTLDLESWRKQRNQFRTKLDMTENVALAYNYQGTYWTREKDWQFVSYDFEAEQLEDVQQLENYSNEIRHFFKEKVPTFFEEIKRCKTGQEGATVFYRFLISSGVQQQLLFWRNQEVERGNLAAARNHEQTWGALIDLLDEYSLIYGDTDFDWSLFQEIIMSGLENLSYGKIPTAIDQVLINRLELVRANQAKITFAIGLNDQVFPDRKETKGLLTSEEREQLNTRLADEKFLFDPAKENLTFEPLQAYLVFSSATERLYLSYSQSYDTNTLKMSPYLRRIHDYLGVSIERKEHLLLESDPDCHVGTYRSGINTINHIYRIAKEEKKKIPVYWLELRERILQSKWRNFALRVFESQDHLNLPVSLPQKMAEELYGKDIYTSISRLENFYNCEYKYFVQFGLKLKERMVYGLTPAATGDFYHESLDRFFKLLFSNQLSLVEMSEKQRKEFTEKVLQEVFGELRFEILDSSARMNYIRYQLGQTIQKVAWALQKQSKNTGMKPLQTEILFGQIAGAKGIPGLELPLNNGGKLHVRGKIDRVDVAVEQADTWLSVVDYKSSGRSFDVTEAYYGMAMQLLTYLDVALMDAVRLTGKAAVRPAGSYYLHVHNPILTDTKEIEKETLKKFSYDGIFVDDPQLLEVLDHSLEAKENSLIYPVKKNAKEEYQKGSFSKEKFYSEEELQLFMAHNRANMRLAGEKITSGEIKLNPAYKDKERLACQFCPFRSICTFDVMLKENNYHRLEKLNKEEALRRIIKRSEEEE